MSDVLSGRDAPSDERSMLDVANHADIALQDSLVGFGDDCHYDAAKFLAAMRGNGYEITRVGEPRGNATSPPDVVEALEALLGFLDNGGTKMDFALAKSKSRKALSRWGKKA